MGLTGTVAAGDLEVWALDCAWAAPSVDPNDGVDAKTDHQVSSPGTYKLCLRASSGSESVAQSGISLIVLAGTLAEIISAVSPISITVNASISVALEGTVAAEKLVV